MASSHRSAVEQVLSDTDIRTGMGLMQTIYIVAMSLGFKEVVEVAYGIFVPPASSRPGGLPLPVVAAAFLAVVLLTIRFFWVPRSLYTYVVSRLETDGARGESRESVFTRVMVVHFPLVLAHSLVFAFICRAFVDLAMPAEHAVRASGGDRAFRFISLYAGLLFLNVVWLKLVTPPEDREPGAVWAYNNLLCVVLAVGALGAFEKHEIVTWALVLSGSVLFIANGVIDLAKTAPYYILFEHKKARVDG